MTTLQKITTTIFIILMAFIAVPQENGFVPKSAVALLSITEEQAAETLTKEVWVTAYSSTPDQTDSTPFITASGMRVQDGLVAANFLPFGTKIKIPEFFGDEVFIVQDRMHERKTNYVDIWMTSRDKAINFGRHKSEIVIVSSPKDPLLARALLR